MIFSSFASVSYVVSSSVLSAVKRFLSVPAMASEYILLRNLRWLECRLTPAIMKWVNGRVSGLCFRKIYSSSRVPALRSVGLRIKPINKASVVGFWILRFENSTIITIADFQEDADDLAQ